MTLQDIFFVAIAGITLLGGFLAVWPKKVFSNALALILCLFGMAGLFIYLNADFLAVVQVIIYIGAISIAIIFAIMLSKPWFHPMPARNTWKLIRSITISILIFSGLWKLLKHTQWPLTTPSAEDYSIRSIGKSLLSTYALPFEVISLILLVAIIGALLISTSKEKANQ